MGERVCPDHGQAPEPAGLHAKSQSLGQDFRCRIAHDQWCSGAQVYPATGDPFTRMQAF